MRIANKLSMMGGLVSAVALLLGLPGMALADEVYSEDFVDSATYGPGSPQWDNWGTFIAALDTGTQTFTSVTFSGSNDTVGFTCSDPVVVAQLADALRNGGDLNVNCDSRVWSVTSTGGCGPTIGVDRVGPNSCSSCDDLWALRPHIQNFNWGGFGTQSCPSGPDQTLTLVFSTTGVPISGPLALTAVFVLILGGLALLVSRRTTSFEEGVQG